MYLHPYLIKVACPKSTQATSKTNRILLILNIVPIPSNKF